MSKPAKVAIACNLEALTPSERERRAKLAAEFARAVIARAELRDGFEFRLDPDKLDLPAMAEWIAFERRCCPFLNFRIELRAEGGKVTVALTGAAGVKEFLAAELLGTA